MEQVQNGYGLSTKRMPNRYRTGTGTCVERQLTTPLCVLNIAVFLRFCVVLGEDFGPKHKPYSTWEMAKEFACCSAGIIRTFCVVFCLIAGFQHFIGKLKIIGTASFLSKS